MTGEALFFFRCSAGSSGISVIAWCSAGVDAQSTRSFATCRSSPRRAASGAGTGLTARFGVAYQSEAWGLAQAVVGTRPRICFFGHHHTRVHTEVAGIECIGLNKVGMPGNLVALDMPTRGRGYEILGERPRPE